MALSWVSIRDFKSYEWIVLSCILIVLCTRILFEVKCNQTYPILRRLLILIITISSVLIVISLIDLKIIFKSAVGSSSDPMWFRITLVLSDFSVWYSIYMTTFLVSYTYFQASL